MACIGMGAALSTACSSDSSERADHRSRDPSSENRGVAEPKSDDSVSYFERTVQGLQTQLDTSAGYAIFPEVGKAALIIGGAHGNGDVYANRVKIGTAELTMGTVGAQLGGQAFSELIVFKDQAALDRFKNNEVTFAANATAVAIKPGAAATNNWNDGVQVYIHIKGGFMAEASVGGQKLTFKPL